MLGGRIILRLYVLVNDNTLLLTHEVLAELVLKILWGPFPDYQLQDV
jgi:hypothetical protein